RIDLENLRLHVLVHLPAQAQFLECVDLVAQSSGLLELRGRARFFHGLLQLAQETVLFSLQHQAQRADLAAVIFAADAKVTGRRALVDTVQDARAEPAPALILGIDIEAAGAELEDALQNLQGGAQALGARAGPVKLDRPPSWRSRKFDPRERLAHAELWVGK